MYTTAKELPKPSILFLQPCTLLFFMDLRCCYHCISVVCNHSLTTPGRDQCMPIFFALTSVFRKNISLGCLKTLRISSNPFSAWPHLKEPLARPASNRLGSKHMVRKQHESPPPIWQLLSDEERKNSIVSHPYTTREARPLARPLIPPLQKSRLWIQELWTS